MAVLIYLHHNLNALMMLDLRVRDLVPIDAAFFQRFITIQAVLGFLLTVIVGPALISRDLANNGLPLYLCRPFTRAEYVVGKMSVLMILLSAITWAPGLLLFLFQSYLEGAGWLANNLRIAAAIFIISWAWILLLSLLSVTISAWVKWRMAAGAALFGLFIVTNVIGLMINELFRTWVGSLVSLNILMQTVTDGLFGLRDSLDMDLNAYMIAPVWSAWMALGAIFALCVFLLTRKVRAYEVVS
jgi:ABC-2 type transport system permease protein